jgi:hypothetical protein
VKQTRHLQQLQKLANLFLLYLHWLQKLYTCFWFDNQCIRGLNEWTGLLLFQSATICCQIVASLLWKGRIQKTARPLIPWSTLELPTKNNN